MTATPTLVLASRNTKKIRELQALLEPLHVQVVSAADLDGVPEVDETGHSFEENARLKAEAVRAATDLPALADDSGLEVEALDGAPGIYSARFAGPDATDESNNALLLERLEGVPAPKRRARFVCVLALAAHPQTRVFRGKTAGTIVKTPRGSKGFGYDPLFYSEELGKTFGEASSAEKHTVSHRGRALRAFLDACLNRQVAPEAFVKT